MLGRCSGAQFFRKKIEMALRVSQTIQKHHLDAFGIDLRKSIFYDFLLKNGAAGGRTLDLWDLKLASLPFP